MTQPFRSHSPVMDLPIGHDRPQPKAAMRPDHDANYLMDEIFGEVEQVLDGSLIPPDELIPLEPARSNSQLDIGAILADRYPQLALKVDGDEALPELPAPEVALSKPTDKQKTIIKTQNSLSLFERLMIFTGCASAIAALGVWLVAQGLLPKGINALGEKLQASSATMSTAESQPTANAVDTKFSEYMLRSLAAIDRNTATKPVGPSPIAMLPAPNNPAGSLAATAKPQPNAITLPNNVTANTLNVPIGRTPVTAAPITPIPVQQPAADVVSRHELNQVMNRIVGMLERIAPGVSNRLQLPRPQAPAAKPANIAVKPPATTPRAAAKVSPAAPETPTAATPMANLPQRTLTGVIEMGDRSAVLFELNGVTQRVYLGESIGSTGWSLVEVARDSAILRRNGEVRTIGVGQKI